MHVLSGAWRMSCLFRGTRYSYFVSACVKSSCDSRSAWMDLGYFDSGTIQSSCWVDALGFVLESWRGKIYVLVFCVTDVCIYYGLPLQYYDGTGTTLTALPSSCLRACENFFENRGNLLKPSSGALEAYGGRSWPPNGRSVSIWCQEPNFQHFRTPVRDVALVKLVFWVSKDILMLSTQEGLKNFKKKKEYFLGNLTSWYDLFVLAAVGNKMAAM